LNNLSIYKGKWKQIQLNEEELIQPTLQGREKPTPTTT
jgi:hypothetical protein